jgi:predicted PurR-regulated permease PerM
LVLHPAVIVVALATGGILGGIVGVFLALPVAGIVSVVLDQPSSESPLLDEPALG